MHRNVFVFIAITILFASCFGSKGLVSIDDWEGDYVLREFNSCCDTATKVRLKVVRNTDVGYKWKLFFLGGTDTVYGKAVYERKQLLFFASSADATNSFFVDPVSQENAVFRMEYDNYYSDKEFRYIDYYTRWYTEMKGYRRGKMLFAGVDYHFKNEKKMNSIKLPK